jgi:peroxiredoxin
VELAPKVAQLQEMARVYVINPDTPENSRQVIARTGVSVPILLDPQYTAAKTYDLAGQGRPMGGLVGWAVIDATGVVREQRVDIDFGLNVGRILEALRQLR